MNRMRTGLVVLLGIAALAVPTTAAANEHGGKATEHGGKAKGHRPHDVAYVFKGVYKGEGSIEVQGGNSRVRKGGFVGETVAFDLEGTRFVTGDTNGDGERSIEDVQEGDWVLVKAMLPRRDPGEPPFAAKRLIDKSSFQG